MPELRQDPITGRWVVVAKERARRPDSFTKTNEAPAQMACPFEYGNESMTPLEVFAFRPEGLPANSPGWTIRVVPNKFPAFAPEDSLEKRDGLFVKRSAFGAHEVIIHGPDHLKSFADYPAEQVALILKAYQIRYRYHKQQPYGRYIQIIVNQGKTAGASIEHPHSQLFAIPIVPSYPLAELRNASDYYREHGRCVFCAMIDQELTEESRVVERTDNYVAFVPYAGRLPFEIWVTPIAHEPSFEDTPGENLFELAALLRSSLRRLFVGLEDPPYNMFLHSIPPDYNGTELYHWHMVCIPKLTTPASFELSTNMWINVTIPEDAAEFLRNVVD